MIRGHLVDDILQGRGRLFCSDGAEPNPRDEVLVDGWNFPVKVTWRVGSRDGRGLWEYELPEIGD